MEEVVDSYYPDYPESLMELCILSTPIDSAPKKYRIIPGREYHPLN